MTDMRRGRGISLWATTTNEDRQIGFFNRFQYSATLEFTFSVHCVRRTQIKSEFVVFDYLLAIAFLFQFFHRTCFCPTLHFTLFCGISKNLILNSQSIVNAGCMEHAGTAPVDMQMQTIRNAFSFLSHIQLRQIHRIARSLSFSRHLSISISRLSYFENVHTY